MFQFRIIMMQAAEKPAETGKTHKEDLLACESSKTRFQDSPKVSIKGLVSFFSSLLLPTYWLHSKVDCPSGCRLATYVLVHRLEKKVLVSRSSMQGF